MGEIIDIAGIVALRAALQATDYEDAPLAPDQQALANWLEQLDNTSPFTSELGALADLLATAPVNADQYTLGLIQGVIDARGGLTAAATTEDEDYQRGYRQGVGSVRPKLVTA